MLQTLYYLRQELRRIASPKNYAKRKCKKDKRVYVAEEDGRRSDVKPLSEINRRFEWNILDHF